MLRIFPDLYDGMGHGWAPCLMLHAIIKIQQPCPHTKKLLQKTHFADDVFLIPCNSML